MVSVAVCWGLGVDPACSDGGRGVGGDDVDGETSVGAGDEVWLEPVQKCSYGSGWVDHEGGIGVVGCILGKEDRGDVGDILFVVSILVSANSKTRFDQQLCGTRTPGVRVMLAGWPMTSSGALETTEKLEGVCAVA